MVSALTLGLWVVVEGYHVEKGAVQHRAATDARSGILQPSLSCRRLKRCFSRVCEKRLHPQESSLLL